jgi:PncC family amidohydrolase
LFVSIASAARGVAELLEVTGCKIVFAESCTGGLVSGALTAIPGISRFHCGGMVVYRNETKTAYLDVPAALLIDPGPVSAEVTELLARRVLLKTPEADLAVAVTGHLGPHAPPELDGRAYATVVWRGGQKETADHRPIRLLEIDCRQSESRLKRQRFVVGQVLGLLADELAASRRPEAT